MDAYIEQLIAPSPWFLLVPLLFGLIFLVGKGADVMLDQAVIMADRWGMSKIIIGATIVSLGTTLPELTVSLFSTLAGRPALAMGNAVGSIICNSGLGLGIIGLLSSKTYDARPMKSLWLRSLIATLVIVAVGLLCGGVISPILGVALLVALGLHLYMSVKSKTVAETEGDEDRSDASWAQILIKFALGLFVLILSSKVLIPVASTLARSLGIPEHIIAASLVAFGTSLPEMVTVIQSTRKGHGELGLGNIMGANILNLLLVIAASAVVSGKGLLVPGEFLSLHYPMLFAILAIQGYMILSKKSLTKSIGAIFLGSYIIYIIIGAMY